MKHGIFAPVAMALAPLALAAVVSTDEFAQAASVEARGLDALRCEVLAANASKVTKQ
ncbi:hypothetical protein [Massilia endophytica]|uniref:hypothetical protein n=1 Tax=Massilia endophytica TaxID=2899220 RepID=UPI001E2EA0B7|nr:hypothetical protein [Massilia endophytica]UGQ48149.1 hypothetical protein LSQ66_06705 [Massilia endophytica]